MKIKIVTGVVIVMMNMVACASLDEEMPSARLTDDEISKRQGKEIKRLCYFDNYETWDGLTENSIIIRRNPREWYKIELGGHGCDSYDLLRRVTTHLGVDTQGTNCITKYTNISQCDVTAIYEWDNSGRKN